MNTATPISSQKKTSQYNETVSSLPEVEILDDSTPKSTYASALPEEDDSVVIADEDFASLAEAEIEESEELPALPFAEDVHEQDLPARSSSRLPVVGGHDSLRL
ncbi:MAG: hypothetical protein J5861_05445, partial [Desulfovibrio sp.]|nr:hypothetical protein [Desulfovibrio sp.]